MQAWTTAWKSLEYKKVEELEQMLLCQGDDIILSQTEDKLSKKLPTDSWCWIEVERSDKIAKDILAGYAANGRFAAG